MPKLKMMLCVMMLPLVVVGCTSKQSVKGQCVKPPPPPAWIMQPPPDWQTLLNGTISPIELITMQKQLEGTQKYTRAVQTELPISMGNSCNYCEQYTRFQRSINA